MTPADFIRPRPCALLAITQPLVRESAAERKSLGQLLDDLLAAAELARLRCAAPELGLLANGGRT